MASTEQTIDLISYSLSVYVGYFNVISGLIGNIINILVFTSLKLFRGNQSACYLTTASTVHCCELIFATATRATMAGFGYDPTRTSLVWCKFRMYIIQFAGVTGTITICFAAIDQYLTTNNCVYLRQMSTFKLAQRLVGGLIVFAVFYDIPFAVFYEIRPNIGCATFNSAFNYFYSFVHLCILIGIVPIVVSSFFSLLAYRNVRRIVRRQLRIVRRRLDHQLTAMVFARVVLLIITSLPFVSYRIYEIKYPVDQNDKLAVGIDGVVRDAVTAIYTINSSGAFYLFWVSSTRFRRQVKYLFYKKIWRKCLPMRVNRNHVAPKIHVHFTTSHPSGIEVAS